MLNCRYPVDHLADGVGAAAVHDGDEGPAVPAVHAVLHPDHPPLHLALLLPRLLHTARGIRNIRIQRHRDEVTLTFTILR